MACDEYPEGLVNEDGADESACERCRQLPDGTIHEMDNGLYRVHDHNDRYLDSIDTLDGAVAYLQEGA